MDRRERRRAYETRAAGFAAAGRRPSIRARGLAWGRLAVFAGAVAFPLVFGGEAGWPWVAAGGLFALFLTAVKVHGRVRRRAEHLESLAEVNRQETRAMAGRFEDLDEGAAYAESGHDFAGDLDLFGFHSVYRWLSRPGTLAGGRRLAAWLAESPAEPEVVRARQEAAAEIADRLAWRQEFRAQARRIEETPGERRELLDWLQRSGRDHGKPLLAILRWAAPLASAVLVPWAFFSPAAADLLLFSVAFQLGFAGLRVRRTNREHVGVSRRMELLHRYAALFALIEEARFEAPLARAWQAELGRGEVRTSTALRRLGGVVTAFDARLNLLVGAVANAFLLWDLQCVWRLESWRRRYRDAAPAWFEDLGRFEALACLANAMYNEPDWTRPVVDAGGSALSARGLGHPLLAPDRRVVNDLELGEGVVAVITGANMAGKSTFLRAVGVNLVLAGAGAPVCATVFRFRPARVYTSMRTTDSLAGGESYFFAELKRLEALVRRLEAGESLFLLIDEMLKGTNSRDQRTGSVALIRRLVALGGSGLVATHDLELGALAGELPGHVVNHCFEVETTGDRMHFDYRLRDGVCRHLNATFLMRRMGIMGDRDEDDRPQPSPRT